MNIEKIAAKERDKATKEKCRMLAKEFIDAYFYPDIQAKGENEDTENMENFVFNILRSWTPRHDLFGYQLATQRTEELEREIVKLEAILEDRLISKDGDNVRASDTYYHLRGIVFGGTDNTTPLIDTVQDLVNLSKNKYSEMELFKQKEGYKLSMESHRDNADRLLEENIRLKRIIEELYRSNCSQHTEEKQDAAWEQFKLNNNI